MLSQNAVTFPTKSYKVFTDVNGGRHHFAVPAAAVLYQLRFLGIVFFLCAFRFRLPQNAVQRIAVQLGGQPQTVDLCLHGVHFSRNSAQDLFLPCRQALQFFFQALNLDLQRPVLDFQRTQPSRCATVDLVLPHPEHMDLARPALLLLLFPFVLLVWLPLWFLLMGTLTGSEELAATIGPALSGSGQAAWTLLPSYPTLEPAGKLRLDTPEYFTTYWNTCLQTFPQLAGQLVVGAPAAWALSRLKFRGRGAVRGLYLILMLLPFQVTMVPAYLTINHLGLMDTVWAVILPGAFSTFPVFVMQRGFDAVPLPLLEAAAIDGATPWQQFARLGLPVGLPGILAALTMSFLDAWNALEQPMTFLKTQSLWSLSLYLTDTTRDLALTMAASLFALLPAVLIFAFGQKYLEQGILAGAVKG